MFDMNKSTSEIKKSIILWQNKIDYHKLMVKLKTLGPSELLEQINLWGINSYAVESLIIEVLSLKVKRVSVEKGSIYDGTSRHKMKTEYYNFIIEMAKKDSVDFTSLLEYKPSEDVRYLFNLRYYPNNTSYLLHILGIPLEVLTWRKSIENYLFTGKNNFKNKVIKFSIDKKLESLEVKYKANPKKTTKDKIDEMFVLIEKIL